MNPLERLDFYKESYTHSDNNIYHYIKKHPNSVTVNSIDTLAEQIHTSKAAIIRFSKKIGYSGFSEFKFELSRYIVSGERESENDNNLDIITSITSLYAGFIKQIHDVVSMEDIKTIAQMITDAHRVKIFGQNRTYTSAMQLRHRLAKIGYDAEAVRGTILLSQICDYLTPDDLIIFFTTRAKEKLYYDILSNAKKNGIKIIMISCQNTTLLKNSDFSVVLPSISRMSENSFLDDQALFFVFIEIILAEIAYIKS
ncbi:MurR/RpiR family transcriptional regulator [Sharpea azabuensis]|uniref:MurR/RpiR family transcriptional regulator n=1 Tax=Sharpea azabuensis TaxID=322505 RepID=UPI00051B32AC|nr:MurR/RpiR family transcriptional regulator [Sharpea azabuensis]